MPTQFTKKWVGFVITAFAFVVFQEIAEHHELSFSTWRSPGSSPARGTESDSDLSQENGAIRYIPYKADESAQADEVGDFNYARAYPEEWMDGNIGVSMELRKRRDQIAHIVTEADIAQEGDIVVNPMIGELPAMEEVQEEFEQLLLSM